jgi:uncharacterized membrane protein
VSFSSQFLASGSDYHNVSTEITKMENNRPWNMATAKKKTEKNLEAEIDFNIVQKAIFILALLSTTYQPCP